MSLKKIYLNKKFKLIIIIKIDEIDINDIKTIEIIKINIVIKKINIITKIEIFKYTIKKLLFNKFEVSIIINIIYIIIVIIIFFINFFFIIINSDY